jgi:hypothetical protein
MIKEAICIGKQDLDMQELYIYMTRSHMIWLKKRLAQANVNPTTPTKIQ